MKKRFWAIGLVVLVAIVILTGLSRSSWRPMLPGYHAIYTPRKYKVLKERVQTHRKELRKSFQQAHSLPQRKNVLALASHQFIQSLEQEFTFWYGTRWNFNGTSQVPGQGSIACGYFVTTTLQDAGVSLNRIKIAQKTSEEIVKSLITEPHIRRFSRVPLSSFVQTIREMGDGLYVVGLDNHVGYLLCKNQQVHFIHASGFIPFCVVREQADYSWSLGHSNYRIVGCLSRDQAFVKKWLLG